MTTHRRLALRTVLTSGAILLGLASFAGCSSNNPQPVPSVSAAETPVPSQVPSSVSPSPETSSTVDPEAELDAKYEATVEKYHKMTVAEFYALPATERSIFLKNEMDYNTRKGYIKSGSKRFDNTNNPGLYKYDPIKIASETNSAEEAFWQVVFTKQRVMTMVSAHDFNVDDATKMMSALFFYHDKDGTGQPATLGASNSHTYRQGIREDISVAVAQGEVSGVILGQYQLESAVRGMWTDSDTNKSYTAVSAKYIADVRLKSGFHGAFVLAFNPEVGLWQIAEGGESTSFKPATGK